MYCKVMCDEDELMMNWTIYIAPYYEKKYLKGALQTFYVCGKDWTNRYVFNYILNDSRDDDCLILTGKLCSKP